ncbi:helix-hairpin-helix motif protein [Geobacter sp. OR-1]|uniref:ComEA family DNA-binding protein n=1 Tax=Geobacter sp. OR-1 TaxID=1266765 RepID=UPI0005437BE8|nr:helix-hairpin-helix domain-containing protein [Geobacter sp. OR-1]GAM07847.1 helix-hairpin-helix motif protein [Geobacter sp. OR-1]
MIRATRTLMIIFVLCLLSVTITGAAEKKTTSKSHEEEVTLTNINTASDTALRSLPGIGESNSLRIIAGRPYAYKEQLKTKKIIRESVYNKIKHLITVGGGKD